MKAAAITQDAATIPVPRTLSAALLIPALVLALALVEGCTKSPPPRPSHRGLEPTQILPGPAGLVSATEPQPNGTMWLLAGPQGARNLRQLTLSQDQIAAPVPTNANAAVLSQSSSGVLAIGFATATTGAVELCSGTTGLSYATIPVAGPVRSLAFGDDGTTLFVLTGAANHAEVSVIATSSTSLLATLPVPADAVSVVPLVDESAVYVLGSGGVVSQVANPGGKVQVQFPAGAGAIAIALSPDGKSIYVLKQVGTTSSRNVSVISAVTESTTKVLPAPAYAVAVAVSPSGSTLYDVVGNARIGNVQAFSLGG
ncbi:MAG: YncE family protein [Acidimicrobiales bacterium]